MSIASEPTDMSRTAHHDSAAGAAFISALVRLVRAEDTYGVWDKKTDADLLDPFLLTKEQRREIPIIGDPDPDTLHRVEQFYRAVGLAIEAETGLMASPMMNMTHEGFGRVILSVGRLVAYAKSLRDVHRFGFDGLEGLAREGAKAVAHAAEFIALYPEVARA